MIVIAGRIMNMLLVLGDEVIEKPFLLVGSLFYREGSCVSSEELLTDCTEKNQVEELDV